ncbi:MAG: hypothetical protein AAF403_07925, partial [Pseudomonadota bacterium]
QRRDLVKELESNLSEFSDDFDFLIERFGTPKELAHQYLKTGGYRPSLLSYFGRFSKYSLIVSGVCFLLLITLIIIGFVFFQKTSKYEFNYFDHTAPGKYFKDQWKTTNDFNVQDMITLDISQSYHLIYWHKDTHIRYRCEKDIDLGSHTPIIIKQNRCIVYLPIQPLKIKSLQSTLFIMNPLPAIDLDAFQSHIKIDHRAINEYRFLIDLHQSRIDDKIRIKKALDSTGQTLFNIKAQQSDIEAYVQE